MSPHKTLQLKTQRVDLGEAVIASFAEHQQNEIAFRVVNHRTIFADFGRGTLEGDRSAMPRVFSGLPNPNIIAVRQKNIRTRQVDGLARTPGSLSFKFGLHVAPAASGKVERPQLIAL